MPNIRIKDIPTTAPATVSGDFFAVDSSASTRKLDAFAPTFGGDVTFAKNILLGTNGPSVPSTLSGRAPRQGLVSDATGLITATSANIGTGNFTASAWINVESYAASVFGFNGAGGIINCVLDFPSDTLMRVYDGAGPTAYTVTVPTRPVNKWFHATWVRSAGVVTCYLDGVSQGTVTANFDIGSLNYIGSISAFNKLKGRVSGLYLYNRALSQDEVRQLYETGVPAAADYNTAGTTINTANFGNLDGASTLTGNSATGVTVSRAVGASYIGVNAGGKSPRPGQRFRLTGTLTLNAGKVSIPSAYVDGTVATLVPLTVGAFSVEVVTGPNGGTTAGVVLSAAGDQNWTISNFSAISIGVVLAPDVTQTGGGLTWYDTSGNNAHITLPATGVLWNVPTSANITSDNALNLRAGGSNQDVIARPSGAGRLRVAQSILAPTYTNNYGLTINDVADTRNVSLGVSTNYAFLQSFNSVPLAINPAGNVVLFGKESSSANGFIQLATHTTTAGGIGFGSDISLSRSAGDALDFTVATGGPTFRFMNGAVYRGYVGTNGPTTVLNSQSGDIQLQTSNAIALHLASNQNATFMKDVILGTSGPSVPSTLSGRAPRQGLVFDGTAGVSANATIAALGTSPLTYEAVFYVPLTAGVGQGVMYVGTASNSVAGNSGAVYLEASGTLRVIFRTDNSNYSMADIASFQQNNAGKFVHFALVRPSSGNPTIYINGTGQSPVYSVTGAPAGGWQMNLTGTNAVLNLTDGSATAGTTILSPRIYNRAFSAAEVKALYENGAPAASEFWPVGLNVNVGDPSTITLQSATITSSNSTSITGANFQGSAAGQLNIGAGFTARAGQKIHLSFSITGVTEPSLIYVRWVSTGVEGWTTLAQAGITGSSGNFSVTFTTVVSGSNYFQIRNFGAAAQNGINITNWSSRTVGVALAPDETQTGIGRTWWDTSGNYANITLPTSGVRWNVPTSGNLYLSGSDGLTLDTNASATLRYADNNVNKWWLYKLSGDINLYLRDMVNARMQAVFTPGASDITASSDFYSNLVTKGTFYVDSTTASIILGRTSGSALNYDIRPMQAGGSIRIRQDSATGDRYIALGRVDNTGAFTESMRVIDQNVLIGTTVNSGALLQVGTNTTNLAGGMLFGTDVNLYRSAADTLRTDDAFRSQCVLAFGNVGSPGAIGLNAFLDCVGTTYCRVGAYNFTTSTWSDLKINEGGGLVQINNQNGNTVIGAGALTTNQANGYFYIPTCPGIPTGTPTSYTGRVPMIYDSTNNKFYIYNGAWKSVALT